MRSRPRTARAAVVVGASTLALATELAVGAEVEVWLPDLVTGMALVVAACTLWPPPTYRAGLLLLAGAAWFAGTAWAPLLTLHLGVLAHLLLHAPARRRRTASTATALAYGVSLGLPLWRSDLAVASFAVGLVLALALVARRPAVRAGAVLSGGLLLSLAARTGLPDRLAADLAVLPHQLAVVLVTVLVVSQGRRPAAAAVTDRVVELGQMGSLRDALATTVADPSLELGHATAGGLYVGEDGRRVRVPAPEEHRRRATFVEREGAPFAVVVHDAAVLDDPDLRAAVATATRLSGDHAALLAALRARLLELDASRRRLLVAADEAQERLELRVREGAERRLRELSELLDTAGAHRPGTQVERARAELAMAADELRSLARGLRPRELDAGLHAALHALAARTPLVVEVHGPDERYESAVETTAWFVCAEAVANAVKHARAGHVLIKTSSRDGVLDVVVQDDGVGGADPSCGSGLRGLFDRVQALHGRCAVDSPPEGGTRVTVELPLDRHGALRR